MFYKTRTDLHVKSIVDSIAVMLAPARRAALSSSKSAAAGSPRTVRRLILAEQAVTTTTTTTTPVCAKYAHAARRHFHASPSTSFFKAAWIPMRVKVPWVDALAQSQQEQTTSKGKEDIEETVKPDLTPRKMSDSYFSAVCNCTPA